MAPFVDVKEYGATPPVAENVKLFVTANVFEVWFMASDAFIVIFAVEVLPSESVTVTTADPLDEGAV